jgi:Zn-dependent alcohol dehydrogenase
LVDLSTSDEAIDQVAEFDVYTVMPEIALAKVDHDAPLTGCVTSRIALDDVNDAFDAMEGIRAVVVSEP